MGIDWCAFQRFLQYGGQNTQGAKIFFLIKKRVQIESVNQ
jgi:hypothetical protein